MKQEDQQELTKILRDWSAGDPDAAERLMPLVYDELRRLARAFLAREQNARTLQPTALVHEAYLRLGGENDISWENRSHFYGVSASIMRRILIDHARAKATEKRGGAAVRLSLEDVQIPVEQRAADLVALDDALERLAEIDVRKVKIVEMRFFGGLNYDQIGEILQLSPRTVLREWKKAKLLLYRELTGEEETP